MKIKDKTMKEFLENNAYFVDFFNAYFFDGERVLKPENCMELDSEMNDVNMELEKHVDVIRKYNDGNLGSLTPLFTTDLKHSAFLLLFLSNYLFLYIVLSRIL